MHTGSLVQRLEAWYRHSQPGIRYVAITKECVAPLPFSHRDGFSSLSLPIDYLAGTHRFTTDRAHLKKMLQLTRTTNLSPESLCHGA